MAKETKTVKPIKAERIFAALWKKKFHDKFIGVNVRLTERKIALSYSSRENAAYCHPEGKKNPHYRIVIGGPMIKKAALAPDLFGNKEAVKHHWPQVNGAFHGLYFHEMGHICFTDMKDKRLFEYPKAHLRGFMKELFNIIEDPLIERAIDRYYHKKYPTLRRPGAYFKMMINNMFLPKCAEYVDTGTVESFMNYLLLALRCTTAEIPNHNNVWDKYKTELMPRIKKVILEPNATNRITYSIELGEWIVENIKEFDFSEVEEPEMEWKPAPDGKTPGGDPMPSGAKPKDSKVEDKADGGDDEGEEEAPGGGGEDDGGDDGDDKGDKSPGGDGEDDPDDESGKDDIDPEDSIDDIDLDDDFDDMLMADIVEVKAKEEYDLPPETVLEKLEAMVEPMTDSVTTIGELFQSLKDRVQPKNVFDQRSGMLDLHNLVKAEISGILNPRIFYREEVMGEDADVAVSLMCDNSGSMGGNKSEICAQAAYVLAKACDYAQVPFECNMFTKTFDGRSGICVTVNLKSWEDKMDEIAPYFGLNSSSLVGRFSQLRNIPELEGSGGSDGKIPTFRGNSEEVNIYYTGKALKNVDHKKKILFVLCDGATTGSSIDLKRVIRTLEEEDQILVIGIGICCREVAGLYPNHKLFDSIKELQEGLAPYLVETLTQFI